MTNKPMLSVERELLEQAVAREPVRPRLEGRNNTCIGCGNWMPYGHREAHEHEEGCLEEISAENRHWVTQLRALLDKQDHPCQVQLDGCDGSCKPAAQHQGEPVAYMCRNIRHTIPSMRTQWEPITVAYAQARMHNKALAAEGKADESLLGDEFLPLYAEQPAPVAVGQPCKIGIYGKAYDLPETKRAYTYKEQPDNVAASKLGRAASAAKAGGDSIDHGLSLLKALSDEGFGVFEIAMLNGVKP